MKKVKGITFPLVLILLLLGSLGAYHGYSHYMVSRFFKYIDNGDTDGALAHIEKMPNVNMLDSCYPIYYAKQVLTMGAANKGYPLYWAAYKGTDIRVFEALLEKGADPNQGEISTPFQMLCERAIVKDWDKKIALFVEYGADVKSVGLPIYGNFREHSNQTKEIEFNAISFLWENGVDDRYAIDTKYEGTELHSAAGCLETEYLDKLYHNEKRSMEYLLNATDANGETPIFSAVRRNYYDNCEFLINEGADLTIKNNEGKTAYDVAVELGYEDCAKLLQLN